MTDSLSEKPTELFQSSFLEAIVVIKGDVITRTLASCKYVLLCVIVSDSQSTVTRSQFSRFDSASFPGPFPVRRVAAGNT